MNRLLPLLAVATASASPAQATPPNRAAEVFEQVCVDGGGQFEAGELEQIEPQNLPQRARAIAMLALWQEEWSPDDHRFATADEMPTRVFHIRGDDDAYLMVADDVPSNPVQAACAVFVKGDRYEELAAYAAELTGNELPNLRIANAKVAFRFGSHGVAVAKGIPPGQQWTLIASAPL